MSSHSVELHIDATYVIINPQRACARGLQSSILVSLSDFEAVADLGFVKGGFTNVKIV